MLCTDHAIISEQCIKRYQPMSLEQMEPDCVCLVNAHDGWGQRQVDQGSEWRIEEDALLTGSMRTLSRSTSQPAHAAAGNVPPRRDRPLPPNAALDARVSESNVWTNDTDVGTSASNDSLLIRILAILDSW